MDTWSSPLREKNMQNNKKPSETAKTVGIFALFVGAGAALYRLFSRQAAPCTPGTTKCEGYNLYTCNPEGKFVLTESNSPECGYVPELWFGENEELGRKAYAVAVVDAGWVGENEEMGSKTIGIPVIDAGWRGENEELGMESLTLSVA